MSLFLILWLFIQCAVDNQSIDQTVSAEPPFDLSNWKLTLPIDQDGDGVADEYVYPFDYTTNVQIKPYLYQSADSALVFDCVYSGVSTPNSKYSRTELREQLVPGDNTTNWTFDEGGTLSGNLKIPEISAGHGTIVMQIHGRLTNEQKDLIGAKDHDAPPLLKIYFQDGKIRVSRKVLVDENSTPQQQLEKSAWKDDTPFYFDEMVNDQRFDLKVIASTGRLKIILNGVSKVYQDHHLEVWPFENYFKAGNYLQSNETDAHAKVWYYALEVTH